MHIICTIYLVLVTYILFFSTNPSNIHITNIFSLTLIYFYSDRVELHLFGDGQWQVEGFAKRWRHRIPCPDPWVAWQHHQASATGPGNHFTCQC